MLDACRRNFRNGLLKVVDLTLGVRFGRASCKQSLVV